MNGPLPRIAPFGDSGVLLTVADTSNRDVARRVHRIADAIRSDTASLPGW